MDKIVSITQANSGRQSYIGFFYTPSVMGIKQFMQTDLNIILSDESLAQHLLGLLAYYAKRVVHGALHTTAGATGPQESCFNGRDVFIRYEYLCAKMLN